MDHLHIHEVGELIRKVRKGRGLRLEDLADENISPATISNIERGVPHVNTQKAQYLLKKLNLDMNDLQQMMVSSQTEQAELEHQFSAAETLVDLGQPLLAEKWLQQDLDDHHPLAGKRYHIQGRLAMERHDWKKAERLFHQALRIGKDQSDKPSIARSHMELARLRYSTGEWSLSLHHTDSGLDACQEDQTDTRADLLLLRALSFEASGRQAECLQTVRRVWESGSFGPPSTKLEWHRLYGEIMRFNGLLEEAERITAEGLQLARRYRDRNALFRLWALSGRIWMERHMWRRAKVSLRTALVWESLTSDPVLPVSIRIWLGRVCTELEQHEEANEWFRDAVEGSQSCSDPHPHIEALLALGEHYQLRGKHQQAIAQYQHAWNKSQEYRLLPQEYDALFLLTHLWEQNGDDRFHEGMKKLYELQKKMKER
ncbi:helix-turn-helix transcriptional regulator [Desmospora profundinema]|uniref:Tetratricopeptide (TPR) repeat protein n=1 Tax=Desmospora profundinema TaxID=1571184 RepID=A0ABU1IRG1_9BACL|nr:helix-turn-helix transcriptional regulator [Desmospora profundinema]MDR6227382.1 tetratricopeptide (TPR) repeat protein [Desmospora profundinema]